MLNTIDILHKISSELYGYSGKDPEAAIEEFVASHTQDFNMAITADVEESEIYFHHKYGNGQTFYFGLEHYEEGKRIAGELYEFLTGQVPEMSIHTGQQFPATAPLVLFIHISRAPVKVKYTEQEFLPDI